MWVTFLTQWNIMGLNFNPSAIPGGRMADSLLETRSTNSLPHGGEIVWIIVTFDIEHYIIYVK